MLSAAMRSQGPQFFPWGSNSGERSFPSTKKWVLTSKSQQIWQAESLHSS